jgi:hypothetical protein
MFASLAQLHAALDRVYKLAVSLPEASPALRWLVQGKPGAVCVERHVVAVLKI